MASLTHFAILFYVTLASAIGYAPCELTTKPCTTLGFTDTSTTYTSTATVELAAETTTATATDYNTIQDPPITSTESETITMTPSTTVYATTEQCTPIDNSGSIPRKKKSIIEQPIDQRDLARRDVIPQKKDAFAKPYNPFPLHFDRSAALVRKLARFEERANVCKVYTSSVLVLPEGGGEVSSHPVNGSTILGTNATQTSSGGPRMGSATTTRLSPLALGQSSTPGSFSNTAVSPSPKTPRSNSTPRPTPTPTPTPNPNTCTCGEYATITTETDTTKTTQAPESTSTETTTITTHSPNPFIETTTTTYTEYAATKTIEDPGTQTQISTRQEDYTAINHDLYETYLVDFSAYDEASAECSGGYFTFKSTTHICGSFHDCMDMCSLVNDSGDTDNAGEAGWCVGVAYTPNGVGSAAPGCWLKTQVPTHFLSGCGTTQSYVTESAILRVSSTGNGAGPGPGD